MFTTSLRSRFQNDLSRGVCPGKCGVFISENAFYPVPSAQGEEDECTWKLIVLITEGNTPLRTLYMESHEELKKNKACTQELSSTTASWAPTLPGVISPAGRRLGVPHLEVRHLHFWSCDCVGGRQVCRDHQSRRPLRTQPARVPPIPSSWTAPPQLGDISALHWFPQLEVRPISSLLWLSGLLKPGMQRTPEGKITWALACQCPTCTHEADSPTAICTRRKLVTQGCWDRLAGTQEG